MRSSIDVERQLVRELETREKVHRRFRIATITLFLIVAACVTVIIILVTIHFERVDQCDLLTGPGPNASVTQATPVALPAESSKEPEKRLVVLPMGGKPLRPPYPNINITHPSFPSPYPRSAGAAVCEPGSVVGGQQLDDLDHEVYMPLMQKALSFSLPALDGEVRDFYHASLASVFRCGEAVDAEPIELVALCKSGYVVNGEDVECDGDGSY